MIRDQGRTVQHFGKWYMWSVSPSGNLTLVLVDRLVDQLAEVRESISAALGSLGGSADPADGERPA